MKTGNQIIEMSKIDLVSFLTKEIAVAAEKDNDFRGPAGPRDITASEADQMHNRMLEFANDHRIYTKDLGDNIRKLFVDKYGSDGKRKMTLRTFAMLMTGEVAYENNKVWDRAVRDLYNDNLISRSEARELQGWDGIDNYRS